MLKSLIVCRVSENLFCRLSNRAIFILSSLKQGDFFWCTAHVCRVSDSLMYSAAFNNSVGFGRCNSSFMYSAAFSYSVGFGRCKQGECASCAPQVCVG